MIYFKKEYFNYDDRANIEAALRKVSLKSERSLDWVSSKSDIGSDKYFLGHDGKNALSFTRIKSSVEFFLPKIIFSLPKKQTDAYYKFGFAIFPFVFYCIFLFGLWSIILSGEKNFENFIIGALLLIFPIAALILELKITAVKIKKAIAKYEVA